MIQQRSSTPAAAPQSAQEIGQALIIAQERARNRRLRIALTLAWAFNALEGAAAFAVLARYF